MFRRRRWSPAGHVIAFGAVAKKKKKAKKDAQFVLRLDRELRDYFVDICSELDTTAAREIRRFIKQFIRQYDDGEFDE